MSCVLALFTGAQINARPGRLIKYRSASYVSGEMGFMFSDFEVPRGVRCIRPGINAHAGRTNHRAIVD